MDTSAEEKLVILLDKATNPHTSELDVGNIDAFCCAVKNVPGLAVNVAKLLADRIQSANPNESLNALNLLDECMAKCGGSFQNAVGRFRFLNELVKLVSPKYLSNQTPAAIKTKILDLLLLWTVQYPKEGKIKEAYEMLRRQGVVHEAPNPISIKKKSPAVPPPNSVQSPPPTATITDPTSLKIKQLIQSKNPNPVDIHATNLLIKNFYEIEQKKTIRVQEIRKGRENVAVLDEMIDQFSVTESSADDQALIEELYEACKLLQPTILLLTEEQNQDEKVMQEALETNDLLMQVVQKYEEIILNGGGGGGGGENGTNKSEDDDALIDMRVETETGGGRGVAEEGKVNYMNLPVTENLNSLEEIFGSLHGSQQTDLNPQLMSEILTPGNLIKAGGGINSTPTVTETVNVNKTDIDSLISEMMLKATVNGKSTTAAVVSTVPSMVPPPVVHNFEGIHLELEEIETRNDLPPRTILNEPAGLKVVLNFTKEHPREDIAVIVVTVANQSPNTAEEIELTVLPGHGDCQVQPVKQKTEKRSLSGVKRFSSAFDDLAEILLVSNPKRVNVAIWSVRVRYRMQGEEHQEMLSVSDLPNLF